MQLLPDLRTIIIYLVPYFGPVTILSNVPPVIAPAPPSFLIRIA